MNDCYIGSIAPSNGRLRLGCTAALGRDCVKTRIEFFAVGPYISERIQTRAEVEIHLSLVPKEPDSSGEKLCRSCRF